MAAPVVKRCSCYGLRNKDQLKWFHLESKKNCLRIFDKLKV